MLEGSGSWAAGSRGCPLLRGGCCTRLSDKSSRLQGLGGSGGYMYFKYLITMIMITMIIVSFTVITLIINIIIYF